MRSRSNFVCGAVSVLLFVLISTGDSLPPKPEPRLSDTVEEADENVVTDPNTETVSFFSEVERQSFLEWLFSFQGGNHPDKNEGPMEPPAHCEPCVCGESAKASRIIGGNAAQRYQYPWMALLMYDKKFYCGATLINDRYVMTASHCADGFNKQKMVVRLMQYDRSSSSEVVIDRQVSRILTHGGYSDVTFNNDIALLRLSEPVKMGNNLRPVCLPAKGVTFKGYNGIVTGWGLQKQGGVVSNVLNEVTVPIMSNEQCKATGYGPRKITDNMLCAGFSEGKKDACQGDSGGPLHVRNGTRYHIVGVVSWGEGCARPKYPGVYARVNRYITWITQNTRDACYCNGKRSLETSSEVADVKNATPSFADVTNVKRIQFSQKPRKDKEKSSEGKKSEADLSDGTTVSPQSSPAFVANLFEDGGMIGKNEEPFSAMDAAAQMDTANLVEASAMGAMGIVESRNPEYIRALVDPMSANLLSILGPAYPSSMCCY